MRTLIAIAVFSAVAAAAPNFTGDWKLNNAKSDFGQMPPPDSMTQKIAHEDPKLKVAIKQSSQRGEFEAESNYTTDGSESTNTIRDNPIKSIVKWDGDALMFDSKARFGENEITIKDKWTASEDGKVLTVERHFTSQMGEMKQKLIFEKQ
jgi:hypothetical protein